MSFIHPTYLGPSTRAVPLDSNRKLTFRKRSRRLIDELSSLLEHSSLSKLNDKSETANTLGPSSLRLGCDVFTLSSPLGTREKTSSGEKDSYEDGSPFFVSPRNKDRQRESNDESNEIRFFVLKSLSNRNIFLASKHRQTANRLCTRIVLKQQVAIK